MNRREVLLGLSTLCISGCSKRRSGYLDSRVMAWEAGIPRWLTETKMPAVSIAIVRDGEIAWRRAFGVKDTGTNEPVDNDTVFAACSNAKPVFAYGVMKLAEKKLVDLDQPLTKYTARRVSADPRLEQITARRVLDHTTGFPNWRRDEKLEIEFEPGSKYQYSGEGFSYLQMVVEEITHRPFAEFMRDDVLKPLGMTSSFIPWGANTVKQIAKPHDEGGKELPDGVARYGAAAMLMTTPGDYAKFMLEFLKPGPGDRFRINGESRREMLQPQVGKDDSHWEGLGWALERYEGTPLLFTQEGQEAGYSCFCVGSAELRSGLMVMMNGDAHVPFLMKMLADPKGPVAKPETMWPEFAKRFFAREA